MINYELKNIPPPKKKCKKQTKTKIKAIFYYYYLVYMHSHQFSSNPKFYKILISKLARHPLIVAMWSRRHS